MLGEMNRQATMDGLIPLSFGYLEPEDIDEGLRRLAGAIDALRARPARRQAVPV